MDECDSRYTKSAQIATRTTSVNICVIKRSNVHSRLSPSWVHIYINILFAGSLLWP